MFLRHLLCLNIYSCCLMITLFIRQNKLNSAQKACTDNVWYICLESLKSCPNKAWQEDVWQMTLNTEHARMHTRGNKKQSPNTPPILNDLNDTVQFSQFNTNKNEKFNIVQLNILPSWQIFHRVSHMVHHGYWH